LKAETHAEVKALAKRLAGIFGGPAFLIGSAVHEPSSVVREDARDIDLVVLTDAAALTGERVISWSWLRGFLQLASGGIVDVKIMERKIAERGGYLRGPIEELGKSDVCFHAGQ